MLKSIDLNEALEIMNRVDKNGESVPFDISFRTYNKYQKTGGRLNNYEGVKILKPVASSSDVNTLNHANILEEKIITRNPNHWKNRTRNLELPNGDKRKIHIRLIISINNYQVVY